MSNKENTLLMVTQPTFSLSLSLNGNKKKRYRGKKTVRFRRNDLPRLEFHEKNYTERCNLLCKDPPMRSVITLSKQHWTLIESRQRFPYTSICQVLLVKIFLVLEKIKGAGNIYFFQYKEEGRFLLPKTNTNRYKASFPPSALSVFKENYDSHNTWLCVCLHQDICWGWRLSKTFKGERENVCVFI